MLDIFWNTWLILGETFRCTVSTINYQGTRLAPQATPPHKYKGNPSRNLYRLIQIHRSILVKGPGFVSLSPDYAKYSNTGPPASSSKTSLHTFTLSDQKTGTWIFFRACTVYVHSQVTSHKNHPKFSWLPATSGIKCWSCSSFCPSNWSTSDRRFHPKSSKICQSKTILSVGPFSEAWSWNRRISSIAPSSLSKGYLLICWFDFWNFLGYLSGKDTFIHSRIPKELKCSKPPTNSNQKKKQNMRS